MPALADDTLAANLQAEASAAHAFYSAHGSDARARLAKKIEALCWLQLAQYGSPSTRGPAIAQVNAFRHEASVPVQDRFDIALAIESQALNPRDGANKALSGVAAIALADKLHAEFGEQDAVYRQYTSLMTSYDQTTALAVAKKMILLGAPDATLSIANAVVARSQLLGKPLNLELTMLGGRQMDLSQPYGLPTLIYFWSNRVDLSDLDAFAKYAGSLGFRWRIFYVCLQADLTGIKAAEAHVPLPGAFSFSQSDRQGNLELTLGLTQTPFVYVLDKGGNVAGYGTPETIPALAKLVSN